MKYTNQTIKINGNAVKQISKPVARRLYNKGAVLYVIPCNMRMSNKIEFPRKFTFKEDGDFDKYVDKYTQQVCNWQYGKYPIYLIEATKD